MSGTDDDGDLRKAFISSEATGAIGVPEPSASICRVADQSASGIGRDEARRAFGREADRTGMASTGK